MADIQNPSWNPTNGRYFELSGTQKLGLLPTRGEKRLIPIEVDQGATNNETPQEFEAITLAKKTLTDYITIRIPYRKNTGNADDNYFYYRFLVNPKSVSIARQTMDAHSMTRAGWQFGIWGEDTLDLSISGITAGEYFSAGLSEEFSEYSISYRNSVELVNVFENNGYFFEGEEVNKSVFAADFTRKRIKSHADVQLTVGNFIWHGMFTSMTLEFTADTPFFNTFSLGFLAWKERYRAESPWHSSITNVVYRGHSKELLEKGKEKKEEVQDSKAEPSSTYSPPNPLVYGGSQDKLSLSPLTDQVKLGTVASANPLVTSLFNPSSSTFGG